MNLLHFHPQHLDDVIEWLKLLKLLDKIDERKPEERKKVRSKKRILLLERGDGKEERERKGEGRRERTGRLPIALEFSFREEVLHAENAVVECLDERREDGGVFAEVILELLEDLNDEIPLDDAQLNAVLANETPHGDGHLQGDGHVDRASNEEEEGGEDDGGGDVEGVELLALLAPGGHPDQVHTPPQQLRVLLPPDVQRRRRVGEEGTEGLHAPVS